MQTSGRCATALGLALLGGCYGRNSDYVEPIADAGDTSDGDGDPGDGDPGDGDGGPGDADSDPSCGDGNADPGELCFSVSVLASPPVRSIAAADFNGDGHGDLGVGAKDDVRVFFGSGAGFQLQLDLPETNGEYLGAVAGDFGGDAVADLLLTNFSIDAVVYYASNGDGTFADPVNLAAGEEPTGLALGRLDANASSDLTVSNKAPDTVSVLLGDGSGGVTNLRAYSTESDEPLSLELGLIDDDPLLDVVAANRAGEEVSILLGIADGSLAMPSRVATSSKATDIAVADLDGDGELDIAVALAELDSIELLFGDGLGGFTPKPGLISVGAYPVEVAAAELNNDGVIDLLILNDHDENVGVLFGNPNEPGTFPTHHILTGFEAFPWLRAIVVADLNNDGVDDVAVGGAELRVLLSDP